MAIVTLYVFRYTVERLLLPDQNLFVASNEDAVLRSANTLSCKVIDSRGTAALWLAARHRTYAVYEVFNSQKPFLQVFEHHIVEGETGVEAETMTSS